MTQSLPSTSDPQAWARLDAVVRRAGEAAVLFGASPATARCQLLRAIAAQLETRADALQEAAWRELGADANTVMRERAALRQQIDALCTVLLRNHWQQAAIDGALRSRRAPAGPAAIFGGGATPVFGAINPDALAALAAGCPVIVHAGASHPWCHALAGQAVLSAVRETGLPEGVYGLAPPGDADALLAHPDIRLAAATGSRADVLRLMRRSLDRAEPIPVLAEASACNPVFILPDALNARAEHLGQQWVRQFGQSGVQRPVLLAAIAGDGYLDLRETAADAVAALAPLPDCAFHARQDGAHAEARRHAQLADRLLSSPHVSLLAEGLPCTGRGQARALLAEVDAAALPPLPLLDEAGRGPAGLLVRCRDEQAMLALAARLGRQQAAILHLAHDGGRSTNGASSATGDATLAATLLPLLERMADRIGINTLLAPPAWHAAAAGAAIERFLRPVTYQDAPAFLLPAALQDDNPLRLWRQVDGELRH